MLNILKRTRWAGGKTRSRLARWEADVVTRGNLYGDLEVLDTLEDNNVQQVFRMWF